MVAPIVVAMLIWTGAERPSVLISESGGLVGQRVGDGPRALSRARGDGFVAGIWLENDGDPADQEGAATRAGWSEDGAGQVATLGFGWLWQLAAVLSVSIGFLNLLPIPVLDGGHLVFYVIEILRGKPVGERAQEIAFRIGISLVLALMLFATWNDVTRMLEG